MCVFLELMVGNERSGMESLVNKRLEKTTLVQGQADWPQLLRRQSILKKNRMGSWMSGRQLDRIKNKEHHRGIIQAGAITNITNHVEPQDPLIKRHVAGMRGKEDFVQMLCISGILNHEPKQAQKQLQFPLLTAFHDKTGYFAEDTFSAPMVTDFALIDGFGGNPKKPISNQRRSGYHVRLFCGHKDIGGRQQVVWGYPELVPVWSQKTSLLINLIDKAEGLDPFFDRGRQATGDHTQNPSSARRKRRIIINSKQSRLDKARTVECVSVPPCISCRLNNVFSGRPTQ